MDSEGLENECNVTFKRDLVNAIFSIDMPNSLLVGKCTDLIKDLASWEVFSFCLAPDPQDSNCREICQGG